MSARPAWRVVQRVDVVLVLLAAVAVFATAAGALSSDKLSGEHMVRYDAVTGDLAAQGPANAGGSGARFNWTVPDNATSARLNVTVSFTGQSVQGGSSTVTVRVTMPDGRPSSSTTSLQIPAGSSSPVSVTLDVPVSWAPFPSDVREGKDGGAATLHWPMPLEIVVVASRPSDVPLANYMFMATAAGTVESYRAA